MKKPLALATATLVVVFVAAPVARASINNAAPANDGTHDFAVGGFEGAFMEHLALSAESGPQGQVPSGHVSGRDAQGRKYRWEVTCLAVEGKDAAIGLVPTEAPPSNAAFEGVLTLHDGGPGAAGDLYALFEVEPSRCAEGVGAAFVPITSGDILVHDN